MSLDTKYRPKTYNDVLGQKGAIKTLRGFVRNNAGWRQSYLFAGPYGSGKTTLGRVLARSLLCEKPQEGEPCDVCGSCVSMLKGSNDAFIEVDAATNSGKADIKQILEPEKMRATVLSRCAPAFIIHHVSSEKIADRLEWVCEKEAFTFEKEALLLIADFSEGHIRDALKAIEGVASSNNGHIGIEGVRSYLHVDRNDLICELLISDEKRTLELCEEILATTPVGVAFERLLSATMFSISLGYGSSNPPPYWRVEILEQAWEQNGVNLLRLAENISSVPRKPSVAMFKCEILKWKVPLESYTVTNRVPVKERLRKENSHKQHKEAEKEKKIEEKETMSLSAFIKSVKEIRTVFNEEVKFAGKRNKLGSTSPLS